MGQSCLCQASGGRRLGQHFCRTVACPFLRLNSAAHFPGVPTPDIACGSSSVAAITKPLKGDPTELNSVYMGQTPRNARQVRTNWAAKEANSSSCRVMSGMSEASWTLDLVCVFLEAAQAAPCVFATKTQSYCCACNEHTSKPRSYFCARNERACDTCKVYTMLQLEKQHKAEFSPRSKDRASTAC